LEHNLPALNSTASPLIINDDGNGWGIKFNRLV